MLRFKELYTKDVVPALKGKFNYTNLLQIPKLLKITLNMGVGEAAADSKHIEAAFNDLTLISGQKPVKKAAKKSVAAYKLREGQYIGCSVTLRGDRMYEFLERLVFVALPRSREFRGLSPKSFDGRGNFSLGIKEHTVFPEIIYDKIDKVRGLDINIVTSANSNEEALELLKGFHLPFIK